LWTADEYAKLRRYDGTTAQQVEAGAFAAFYCHRQTGELCGGWVGCHDMSESLAVRMTRNVDVDAVRDYVCSVPLFSSGAEAAAHGMRDIECPGQAARRKAEKLRRLLHRSDDDGDD
jgi:hypothetical protein